MTILPTSTMCEPIHKAHHQHNQSINQLKATHMRIKQKTARRARHKIITPSRSINQMTATKKTKTKNNAPYKTSLSARRNVRTLYDDCCCRRAIIHTLFRKSVLPNRWKICHTPCTPHPENKERKEKRHVRTKKNEKYLEPNRQPTRHNTTQNATSLKTTWMKRKKPEKKKKKMDERPASRRGELSVSDDKQS